MKAAIQHYVKPVRSAEEMTELEFALLDSSYAPTIFDGATLDVIYDQKVVARSRAGVFTQGEVDAAWEAFPDNPDSDAGLVFLRAADHLFTAHATFAYVQQQKLFEETGSRRVNGTCFNAVSAYKGGQFALRRCPGYLLLAVLDKGICQGGLLMLPQYGCAFRFHPGDLLIVEPDEWIADTEITGYTEDFDRLVVEMDSYVFEDESQLL